MQQIVPGYYAQLGDILFNGVDDAGVKWVITSAQGLDGTDTTLNVQQRPRADGGVPGGGYATARTVVLEGFCIAPDESSLAACADRLQSAVPVTPTTLAYSAGSGDRHLTVYRAAANTFTRIGPVNATWSLHVVAPDPRQLGATLSVSTALPSTTGGLVINNTGTDVPQPPQPQTGSAQPNFGGTGVVSVTVSTQGGGSQTSSNAYPSDSTNPSDSTYPANG